MPTTATFMAVRTDVATTFRQTRRFRPVATARLGSIEAQGQGEAMASLAATVKHYGDGVGSTEMIGDVGKSRGRRKSDGDGVSALKSGSEAQGSHDGTLSRASTMPQTATTRLEANRRSPAVSWLPRLLFIKITELPLA